ncbi:hypothetical protein WJ32_19000 (plasmid) [Burkholderia ubonensis]|uniref:Fis family transcriptional regulator n=2 Tax=Burkholderia ubonensis TaxID=101571 RepID=A0A103S006_9BURK|nr:hypothetical protein WJ32_19000 [Burkholderia ubonensis]KVG77033.1 hypothetical protein WJ33_01615 [Burkholderia ubonensis]
MKKPTSPRGMRSAHTREMLLPISTATVQSLSLENHIALATIRTGRGSLDQVCCLLRVIYLAYLMRSETATGADVEPYRRAEAALDACIKRIKHDEPCLLLKQEQTVIERVLVLHDEQLAAVPKFRYLDACDRLQRYIGSERFSPIRGDAIG